MSLSSVASESHVSQNTIMSGLLVERKAQTSSNLGMRDWTLDRSIEGNWIVSTSKNRRENSELSSSRSLFL
jgi:hypothetical protein